MHFFWHLYSSYCTCRLNFSVKAMADLEHDVDAEIIISRNYEGRSLWFRGFIPNLRFYCLMYLQATALVTTKVIQLDMRNLPWHLLQMSPIILSM